MEQAREKTTVQIATFPQRESSLKMVIESLLPQVDLIRVMLNNYTEVPLWLDNPKIEAILWDNSILDGIKFLKADQNKGYVLICDDDILYPPDFVETMKKHLKSVGRNCVVSIMGKNLLPVPMKSYALGGHEFFRAFERHTTYYKVNMIGMCGAIYHSDFVKISEKDMHVRDSDICASAWCHQHGIKMYVCPHEADWCEDLIPTLPFEHQSETMWMINKEEAKDKIITAFINENLRPAIPRGEHGNSFMNPNDDMA